MVLEVRFVREPVGPHKDWLFSNPAFFHHNGAGMGEREQEA